MDEKQVTEAIKGVLKLANTSSNELSDFSNYNDLQSAIGSDKFAYLEAINGLVDFSLITKVNGNCVISNVWRNKTWKDLIQYIANKLNNIIFRINIDFEKIGKKHIYFLMIVYGKHKVQESYIV